MARGALGRQPLIEEDIRSLLAEAPPRGPLPILLLHGEDPEWRAVVHVVRARAGGFGIVAPLLESVQAALDQIVDDDGEAAVLIARRSVATETVRRRATGSVDVFLADVPWSGLPYFRRSGGLRLTQGSVQTIEADSIAVRPSREAAETAFGEWVAEAGLDETMQEYLTAEEEEAGPLAAEPAAVGGIGDPAAQLAALQERLEALQRQVDDVPRPAPEPPLVDRPRSRSSLVRCGAGAVNSPGLANSSAVGWRSSPANRGAGADGATGARGHRQHPDRGRPGCGRCGRRASGPGFGESGPASKDSGRPDPAPEASVAEAGRCIERRSPRCGQRARQLKLRRSGPHGSGSIPSTIGRSSCCGLGDPRECRGRIGDFCEQRPSRPSTRVSGQESSFERASNIGLSSYFHGPWLAGSQGIRKRRAGGLDGARGDGHRADDFGQRQAPDWLATHWVSGASVPSECSAEAPGLHETVCQASQSILGSSLPGLCEGPRLSRRPSPSSSRKGIHFGERDSHRGAKGESQVAPKEPEAERGGGGRILAPPSTVQEARQPRGLVSETLEPQFCESYFQPAALVGECIPDEPHFHKQAEGAGSGLQLPPSPDKIPSRTARLGDKVPDFNDLSLAPGSVHVFDSWVQGFLRTCSRTPICLGAYVRLSLQPSPCTAYEPTEFGDDIWPVPPPAWCCWSGPCKLGPRRRRKQRSLSFAYALVQRVVCCLNWLTLGYPKVPPPQARVGASCTAEQSSVIDLLLRHALHFVSQGSLSSSELGRSAGKFDQLAKFVCELPELPDVDMDPILHDVYRSLDPYSRPPKPRVPEDCEPIPEEPRISPRRVPTDNGDTFPRDCIASGLGDRRALQHSVIPMFFAWLQIVGPE